MMARRIAVNTLVFVLGFITCAYALHRIYGAPFTTGGDKSVVLANLNQSVVEPTHGPNPVASAARTVMPAVVTIDTLSKPMAVGNPMSNDPFFRQFFGGDVAPQTQREKGVGSGVLISPDGYIVTNNHVIDNAENIKVTLYDGKAYKATLVGSDSVTDIAVCKIDVPNAQLPYAALGESKTLEIGDSVIAIGDPLNVGTTVTSGIVSALGHRSGMLTGGPHPLAGDIIQTDAAINPGNSGGALADLNGKVVGINEAIYSETGGFVGIGFAIPIDTARTVAEELIKNGEVTRPYIGIEFGPLAGVTAEDRQQIGVSITGDSGAIVTGVSPHSPAADAGLQNYDVILEANTTKIGTDPMLLKNIISKLGVGSRLVLLINRSGHNQLISLTVKQMPKDFGKSFNQQGQDQSPNQGTPDQGGNGNQLTIPGF